METFTPVSATLGGMLIGAGAVVLMAASGRIAGISGIFGGLLPPRPVADWAWRLAFVAGLAAGAFAAALMGGGDPTMSFTVGLPAIALAGLLVGLGTSVGSGCTSGHGVCGLARFSARALAAVAAFMVTGALVVFVVRHVLGT